MSRPEPANGPVLWYVHHHGVGHWRRALAVVRRMTRDVVLMSSTPPPDRLPDHARYVPLAPDFPAAGVGAVTRAAAGGVLHWAPPHHRGLLARHGAVLAQAIRIQPSLAVVDVSVELTVLLRTSGVPVIAVRLPGERTDPAHQLGFDLADEVLMPVPARWGLHSGLRRTVPVGLVSALAPRPVTPVPPRGPVVVVVGAGGSRLDLDQCARIAADLPDRRVRVLGISPAAARTGLGSNLEFTGRIDDPTAELAAASVVVTNGGLGSLADAVRAGRPLVVLPEDRPFDEQLTSAAALGAGGDAVVLTGLPGPGGWSAAITRAEAAGPPTLNADGARHFADRVEYRAGLEDALRPVVEERRMPAVRVERRARPRPARRALEIPERRTGSEISVRSRG